MIRDPIQWPRWAAILVVAVAAIVIGIGIRLAIGLVSNQVASEATPSPGASASTSALPTTSASPVESSSPPASAAAASPTAAPVLDAAHPLLAVVQVNGLRIRQQAGLAGRQVASLNAGDVVWVDAGPVAADGTEWWEIRLGGELSGWVSAGTEQDPYLDLRNRLAENLPARVYALAAGDAGFLAWGVDAGRSDEPEQTFLLSSADGVTWRRVTPVPLSDAYGVLPAWGPSGWVIMKESRQGGPASFLGSPDGTAWTSIPGLGDTTLGAPEALVASPAGYALRASQATPSGLVPHDFFSSDGRSWREVTMPPGFGGAWSDFLTDGSGFLRWQVADQATQIIGSVDGAAWAPLGAPLPETISQDPLVARQGADVWVVPSALDGDQRVWRLASGAGNWQEETDAESLFAGAVITDLVSNGRSLLVVGHAFSDSAARSWITNDGASFAALDASALFGGFTPDSLVASPAGFAASALANGPAGPKPLLWSSADGAAWAEAEPILGQVSSAAVGGCPPLPTSFTDWAVIPPAVAVECFGDTPMTFTAYVSVGDGCGGYAPGIWEPNWLAFPFGGIDLEPHAADPGTCGGSAVSDPSLTTIPTRQWVTVTGHYDDPSATTCQWLTDPAFPVGYTDKPSMVWTCQRRFVLTDARPAAAPGG